MLTDDDSGIPFLYAREQQGLRLLELPPELYDLLCSKNPPALSLKSAAVPTTTEPSSTPSHAVLCTQSKTFQLRQVQTSNTVLVAQPTQFDNDALSSSALSVFATCSSTLELQPLTKSEFSKLKTPFQWLTDALTVYEADGPNANASEPRTKSEIFADIPYSDDECEEAWIALLAFEKDGGSYRPSADLAMQTWTALYQTATALDIDLTGNFKGQDLREALEDVEISPEISGAVLHRISRDDAGFVSLDKTATIAWLGEASIWATTPAEQDASGIWQVLERWRDLLPEKWRKDLTTKDVMELRAKVKGTLPVEAKGGAQEGEEQKGGAKRPSTGRNWHEKFKRARK